MNALEDLLVAPVAKHHVDMANKIKIYRLQ
jgi:hypothetical protein